MNCEYLLKKSLKTKTKKVDYALQPARTDFWCFMDEERLDSFMMEVSILQKSILRYDKITDSYYQKRKHQKRILLINPLSKY